MEIIKKFKSFIHYYDPVNFQLIYSLKVATTIAINCFLCFYFFGISGAIMAVNITMGIFFISALECKDSSKLAFLLLYIALSSLFMPFVTPLMSLGVWLSPIVFIWVFIISISQIFSVNLNKILLAVNATGLVAFVTKAAVGLNVADSIGGLVLAGVLSIIIKFENFGKYGKFTKKSIGFLLDNAILSSKKLGTSEFKPSILNTINLVDKAKEIFASQSLNLKDIKLVRNQTRAVFYLYKVEEIVILLRSLEATFERIDDKGLLEEVKNEIAYNLFELKNIFASKSPKLKFDALNAVKSSKFQILSSSLSVLYDKFLLIKEGGEDKISFNSTKKSSLKKAILKLNLKNETLKDSLRLAICMAVAIFISQATHINHGIWIAIAVMSLNKNDEAALKNAGRDNVLGGVLGFFVALGFIELLGASYVFYVVCFVGMFLLYYLKAYKQIVFAAAFMFEFTAIFSLIKSDFLELMVYRIFDVVIGFLIVFVAYLLTSRNDYTKIKNSLSQSLVSFENLVKISFLAPDKYTFNINEKSILASLDELNYAISAGKNLDDENIKNAKFIAQRLDEINSELVKLRNYAKIEDIRDRSDFVNDTKIISDRFLMLEKKLKNLPYYFIEEVGTKLLCTDANAKKLISRVISKQNEIYSALSF
jgi:hypothetical protein